MQLNYTCVNCGSAVKELYKKYSSTVLKLTHCNSCLELADKYIEYDPVIIMIDLVLLNKQAYRHILYNSHFENHWKLAVVLLLVETYSEWATQKSTHFKETKNKVQYDLFEGEKTFYLTCLVTIIGTALFFCFVMGLALLQQKTKCFPMLTLWKAMVLSSFGKFLMIPELIWGEITTSSDIPLIMGYTFISQLQAYSVVCGTSRKLAAATVFVGLAVKLLARHMIMSSLTPFF